MYYVEVYNRHYDTYDCYLATPDKVKAEKAMKELNDRGYFAQITHEGLPIPANY